MYCKSITTAYTFFFFFFLTVSENVIYLNAVASNLWSYANIYFKKYIYTHTYIYIYICKYVYLYV